MLVTSIWLTAAIPVAAIGAVVVCAEERRGPILWDRGKATGVAAEAK